jgi:hypothetical protein
MLCSKLCGILTVQSPEDAADESISITLAVRTGSSSSLLNPPPTSTSTAIPDEVVQSSANGLPPLATPSPLGPIPAWVRKTSRLKVQWIELSHASTPRQTQLSLVKGNEGVTLDVGTAQRALQTATRDRSLLESMFRIAGNRVQSIDVGCTFSDTPLSARNTSRFSSMRSLTDSTGQLSATRGERTGGAGSYADRSPATSPLRSARGAAPASPKRRHQPQQPLSIELTPTFNASVASSRPPVYHKLFWFGFIVGGVFGATGVLTMLGQSGQLWSILDERKQIAMTLAEGSVAVASKFGLHLQQQLKALIESKTTGAGATASNSKA